MITGPAKGVSLLLQEHKAIRIAIEARSGSDTLQRKPDVES